MADNISNQRAHVIEHVQLFINETIPLLQEHIDEASVSYVFVFFFA